MDASLFGKRCFDFAVWRLRIKLQSYIRPVVQTGYWISLLALMEYAGEDLIFVASSKDRQSIRFASPRSDLSRHHQHICLRNLSAIQLLLFC